jgi:hypothetical protein
MGQIEPGLDITGQIHFHPQKASQGVRFLGGKMRCFFAKKWLKMLKIIQKYETFSGSLQFRPVFSSFCKENREKLTWQTRSGSGLQRYAP